MDDHYPSQLLKAVSTLLLITIPAVSYGHGYIENSRSHFCRTNDNSGCGSVQYEPQSVEGPDRFPDSGPADGQIASAGLGRFSNLNEQTPTRWKKSPINAGVNTFSWTFTATHSTRDFRYFITRPDWNPSEPLARSSFDLTPFCEYSVNNQRPPSPLNHSCNVPGGRNGYHVILGVWDVADTASSFYQVVDVNFSGTNPPVDVWNDVGDIQSALSLAAGDRVSTRVFDANGEIVGSGLQTSLTIATDADGAQTVWPFLLAERINQTQNDIKAGIQDENGSINPSSGRNDIFARPDSGIVRVEIDIEQNPVVLPTLSLSGVADEYTFSAGDSIQVNATVLTEFGFDLLVEIFDASGQVVAMQSVESLSNHALGLIIESPVSGTYSIVAKLMANGEFVRQVSADFEVVAAEEPTELDYDYVYPNSKSSYQAGDLVLGTDGNIYQCKPHPYSGWCRGKAAYFAPGTGYYWSNAWTFIGEGGEVPAVEADYAYPNGRGSYQDGALVSGIDGNVYRCLIAGWCNGSELYYAPGTGLAWTSAWMRTN